MTKTMEEISLERKIKGILELLCEFGSLWIVGEDLWKRKLPPSYVQRNDRVSHPGICIETRQGSYVLHATASMLFGCTFKEERDLLLIKQGKRFLVEDFYSEMASGKINSSDVKKTVFGSFGAVPIEVMYFDQSPKVSKRLPQDEKKIHVIPNNERKLSPEEMNQLRNFVRRFISRT